MPPRCGSTVSAARISRALRGSGGDRARSVQIFFKASAPRLLLTTGGQEVLQPFIAGEQKFDAIVLGAHLEITAILDTLRQLRARDGICR